MASRRPPQLELEHLNALDDGRRTRDAGLWAKEKLAIVSAYCRQFTTACKRAGGGIYIDAFCGPGINRVRGSGECLWGSPMIAKRTTPEFSSLYLMDQDTANVRALEERVGNDSRVHLQRGDANTDLLGFVAPALSSRAPVFCLLDPHGIELRWSTVQQLARKRLPAKRCELLILFSDAMGFMRLLPTSGPDSMKERVPFDMNIFFGTGHWYEIYQQKIDGYISPEQARQAYVDLYADQLRGLGYATVLAREVRDRGSEGRPLYHLLFASDDPAGQRIMTHLFDTMKPLQPQLRLLGF